MSDDAPRPQRSRMMRVLVGTAPGLERFLLAAIPAMAAAGVAIGVADLDKPVGFGIGLGVLLVGILVTRKAFR